MVVVICVTTACSRKTTNEGINAVQNAMEATSEEPKLAGSRSKNEISVSFDKSVTTEDKRLAVDGCVLPVDPNYNGEKYEEITENAYKAVAQNPLSTFSIDVDTASYSNIRRFIMDGGLPPKDAIRIEEMVNYFPYTYQEPAGEKPLAISSQIAICPWNDKHSLARLTLKAKDFMTESRPANNLVFLLDVSGSMDESDKLPLLKSSFKLLVNQLDENDKVSIVVYAGAAGVVLDATYGHKKEKILDAINDLNAGGSTAGGEGIELAYKIAEENYIKNGNNRIILATDGDFNVGPSSTGDLTKLIEKKRKSGIFLSVFGFGTGNLNDSTAELLADKGNGNYAYIDTILEAKKVLIEQIGSTLYTVAKDVKYQIEFNPAKVKGYRLIGYENRLLNDEDFDDDTKDAGEIGAGHVVTAFYELIPADSDEKVAGSDLKYQKTEVTGSDEWMTIKVRYKEPKGSKSKLIEIPIKPSDMGKADKEFDFASSVAEFGLLLRDSAYKGDASYQAVIKRAKASRGTDKNGYRSEFIKLVELVREMDKNY